MMFIKVISANYLKDYQIEMTFNDGIHGKVDLRNRLYGEVFGPLLDIELFKKFLLNEWTIEWENGADLAPEYLYELCLKQNEEKLAESLTKR